MPIKQDFAELETSLSVSFKKFDYVTNLVTTLHDDERLVQQFCKVLFGQLITDVIRNYAAMIMLLCFTCFNSP